MKVGFAVLALLAAAACVGAQPVDQATAPFLDTQFVSNMSTTNPQRSNGFDFKMEPNTTFLYFEGPLAGQDPLVAHTYSPTDPQQVHLGFAGPNAYYVMWATGYNTTSTGTPGVDFPTNNPLLVKTQLRFGLAANALNTIVQAEREIYNQIYNVTYSAFNDGRNLTQSPPTALNYTSPVLSSAVLPITAYSTQYFYQVSDANGVFTGEVFSFISPPAPASFPQRVCVIADLGMSYNSSTTMGHVQDNCLPGAATLPAGSKSAYLLNIGDMAYADNINPDGSYPTIPSPYTDATGPSTFYVFTAGEGLSSATYQPLWDAWLRFLSRSGLTKIPMAASPGNHEIEQQADRPATIFASYQARLKNSHRGSSSTSFHYYSFNYGPVHNILLSPYVDYTIGSPQYDWLLNDLQAIDRTQTPFVVAGVHNPWYTTDTSFKEFEQMRVNMEPIMYQFGVDVMFNGHVHSYERMNPVYNYVNNPCGMVHLVVGDGGNSEGVSGLNYYTNTQNSLYEDTSLTFANSPQLNTGGCPYRGLTYRPGYMRSLNPSVDYFSYYNVTLTFQGDGNSTGSNGAVIGNTLPCGYCWNEQPPWSAYRESSFGHGTLDVLNATTALWTWHRNQNASAVAGDQVYIVRPPQSQCPNKYTGGAPASFVAAAPSLPVQTGVCNPPPATPAPTTAAGGSTPSPTTAGGSTPGPSTTPSGSTPSPTTAGGSTPSPTTAGGSTPAPTLTTAATTIPSPTTAAASTPSPTTAAASTPSPTTAAASTPAPTTAAPVPVPTVKPLHPLLGNLGMGNIAQAIKNHFAGGILSAEDTDAVDAAVKQAVDDEHHK